ncbi:MAG: hypothetical protein VKO26_01605 [Cyanobacteriota bacterium]|nr:hypothetical protein [Cyanobacteriota bacterium]
MSTHATRHKLPSGPLTAGRSRIERFAEAISQEAIPQEAILEEATFQEAILEEVTLQEAIVEQAIAS